MEEVFRQCSNVIATAIEAIAVLIVAWGALESAYGLIKIGLRPGTTHGERKVAWRRLGMWLLLGLEFELAADIVRSVIAPSWIDIGQLGAIAAIRTFLNYFLEKDLEETTESPGEAEPA